MSSFVVSFTTTETIRLIRDGRRWGKRGTIDKGRLYAHRYDTFTTRMIPALRWAARTAVLVSTNHSLFEEKGEPKRNRAAVLSPLGQTGSALCPVMSG